MAAAGQNASGQSITLHSSAQITSKTETNIEAARTSANLIGEVADLTLPTKTRGVYTRMPYGAESDTPVPGRVSFGELSFSVYSDNSNTKQVAIRDDNQETIQSYIVTLSTGSSANSYFVWDGFITTVGHTTPADDLAMLDITVQTTAEETIVADS